MSKRSNQDPVAESSKRSKTENHAPGCSDDTCTGCDVGEVEIAFTKDDGEPDDVQPTAQELVDLAIDESKEGDNEMARRLFDMALEKFQEEEPDNRVGYADCLIELGKAIEVEESIKEGLDILKGELKKESNDTQLKLKLAYASMVLANYMRKQKEAVFARQEAELHPSDDEEEVDEEAYEELLSKQQVTKEEIQLYKEAVSYAREVVSSQKIPSIPLFQRVIGELRTYGLSLDLPVQKEHTQVVLEAAIEFIQQVPGYEENWELITIWAACLTHQEKLLDKTQERIKVVSKAIELANKANDLHVAKLSKEHPFMCELLAGLLMTQSGLVDDEDEAVELYERAFEAFKKAHELAPEKVELAEMIKVLEEMKESSVDDA
ncbi:hypothetical protein G6F37_003413 [Rhizopus arrhizus]|nr:hypothetical protein G6F38_003507 [Rhizopus arrhizus]KAG1161063.1 hypothetical protein G6F37_003413 [Rhizopus arrhizus]